ncbi:MAG: homoserine dehydrogenase [Gammaproteobacteria bacterium]|nr:homoserine dehydrogenase [Gammaproteobacteria bacterium]
MTLPPVKLGVLGLGTVGCGTLNVLARNRDEIARRAGRNIEVVAAAARDLARKRPISVEGIRLTDDPYSVVDDPSIEIVVELIGGTDPARELVLRALDNGKDVVTANKALIALHGNEVFARAQAQGLTVAFEAAVAGGIPVIKTLREALAGNTVEWLAGIINGTCNFMLTAMYERGANFADVLAEAQALGYAEADPSFDIDGIDAAHKLTILASIAFGIPLQFAKVHVEGIRSLTLEDVRHADQLGYRIKHLAFAKRGAEGIELRVHPTLVPRRVMLAHVNGVMNGILLRGDAVGPLLLSGAGAGADATASSVVADIVDVVRALTVDPTNRVPHLAFRADSLSEAPILPMADIESAYYLRLSAADQPGVLADITRILADLRISIEAIRQSEAAEGETTVPIIILTHRVAEAAMNAAVERIARLDGIAPNIVRIRMEEFA